MGNRGPKPKPTSLRVFAGTRQKPGSGHEPKAKASRTVPEPPEWLGDYGKERWRYLAPLLFAVNILTEIDVDALAQLCSAWDDFRAANADIEENGLTVIGSTGSTVANPAVRIKHAASERIRAFGDRFGLSPTSRVGLSAPVPDEGCDDLEQFKAS